MLSEAVGEVETSPGRVPLACIFFTTINSIRRKAPILIYYACNSTLQNRIFCHNSGIFTQSGNKSAKKNPTRPNCGDVG